MLETNDPRLLRLKLLQSLEDGNMQLPDAETSPESSPQLPENYSARKLGNNTSDFVVRKPLVPPPPPSLEDFDGFSPEPSKIPPRMPGAPAMLGDSTGKMPAVSPLNGPPPMPAPEVAPDPMAGAVESDRLANNRRVLETSAHQLIAGLTQTPTVQTFAQQGNAVAGLKQKAAQDRLDALKRMELGIQSDKWNWERHHETEKDNYTKHQDNIQNAFTQTRIDADKAKADADAKQAPFTAAGKLRQEFDALPEVKRFKDASVSFAKVKSSALANSPAGDISLVFAYMKMLDPGSTVREGEQAEAQQATGVPGRIINIYNNLVSGRRLSPEQVADFSARAAALFKDETTNYSLAHRRYSGLATKQNLDPSDITLPPQAYQYDNKDYEAFMWATSHAGTPEADAILKHLGQ
jgi:hypothetical protein